MKLFFAIAIALTIGAAALPRQAVAKGCIKGMIVGGIAGHAVGHGVVGAVAGCVAGRHMAKQRRDASQGQQRQYAAPAH